MRSALITLAVLVVLACAACPTVAPQPKQHTEMDARVFADEQGVATPLVCPGAIGCETTSGALRAGAGARTITPLVAPGEGAAPVWLAGFDIGREATGVHDDVWARALVVEQGDLRVGLVVLDAIGFFHHDVLRVRRAAAEAGLNLDHVIVASTHTHESKDTMGIWGESVGATGYDDAYQQHIVAQAAAALGDAVAVLADATLTVARTEAAQFVRDTRLPEVRDDALDALQFWDRDGAPLATLIVWGNHPEALGGDNTLVTSDYPHALREEVEARLPGTIAVFASGTLGGLTTPIGAMVCPDTSDPDVTVETCPQGTFERADAIGRRAATIAVDALLGPDARDLGGGGALLRARRLPLMFTPTNRPLALAFQLGMMSRPIFDTETGELLSAEVATSLSIDDVELGLVQVASEVSSVGIGGADGVQLLAVPGELYGELWLAKQDGTSFVERPAGGDFPSAEPEPALSALLASSAATRAATPIVLNQAGDSVGYIIPAAQWDFEEPFAYDPSGQYGEQNSLGPHAAPELAAAVEQLVALEVR